MIYTGYYKNNLPLALDKFPILATMCEKEMMKWGKENYQLLNGCFVNNCYLLFHVPAQEITVILKNKEEHILSTHPKFNKWKDEFTSGEFYTFINLEDWK